jgi:hypothetical protein
LRLVNVTDKLIHHLERQVDFFQKQHEFLAGKVERLELVVMAAKSDSGREYVERSDRAAEPRKPPIGKVRADQPPAKPSFSEIREKWNSLSADEQEEAIKNGDLAVEGKGRPA